MVEKQELEDFRKKERKKSPHRKQTKQSKQTKEIIKEKNKTTTRKILKLTTFSQHLIIFLKRKKNEFQKRKEISPCSW